MKKLSALFVVLLLLTAYYLQLTTFPVHADELEDIQKQLDELNKARQLSVNATKPLEGQLEHLKAQLSQLQSSLNLLSLKIIQKEKDLNIRTEKVAQQQAVLESRVRSYYIRSFLASPLLVILGNSPTGDIFRELSYRMAATREDERIIGYVTGEINDLLAQKEKLEKDKVYLAQVKVEVDKNATFIGGEVDKAKTYQAKLNSQIASLNARQQQIIAEKQASLNLPTSLGAGPLYCTDDRKLDPGFSNAFAFFTYGIPHRVGMNQYGAFGRAKAGQNYKDILNAYFNGISFEKRSNVAIKVAGFGSMPLEQYMLGIYEIPGDWPMESLKAQALASRSYALSYTNNGEKEICTSQSCQVYKGGNKGGGWEQAVKATEGEVMISGGSPITAWFSSTDGGYTHSSGEVGWSPRDFTKSTRDTSSDVSGWSDLAAKAYDKDSPCFYAAQGFRPEYAKSAWLKSPELADITNALLLTKRDSGVANHIFQPDKPNPAGTDTWDAERVKSELRNRGGTPLNNVSDVSINADFGSGQTTTVTISGDGGSFSFSGSEFKSFFNLRAPANISIVGPLYNIERK